MLTRFASKNAKSCANIVDAEFILVEYRQALKCLRIKNGRLTHEISLSASTAKHLSCRISSCNNKADYLLRFDNKSKLVDFFMSLNIYKQYDIEYNDFGRKTYTCFGNSISPHVIERAASALVDCTALKYQEFEQ